MAAAQHGRPNGHEVCHGVISITDELANISELLCALWVRRSYFLEIVCN